MPQNVFHIDRIVRKGVDCLIEGVKREGSPFRKTRMTVSGDGVTYRLEGSFTPRQALELYACLPRPHEGLRNVEARVTVNHIPLSAAQQAATGRSSIPDWNLTVTRCHPLALVAEGATYAAFDFGMLPPIAEPNSGTVDDDEATVAPRP